MAAVTATRNVVITGANRGLGLEMVRQLCANECDPPISKIYALCRKTSPKLTELVAAADNKDRIAVVEGIDVTKDDVGTTLQLTFGSSSTSSEKNDHGDSPPLTPSKTLTPIHCLIHNAGAYGMAGESFASEADMYASQTLENITMERMRASLELNTLAPLKVTQALLPHLKAAAGSTISSGIAPAKVIIISSLMGSISDNTSGDGYGYRTAKAGVNMVGRSLAQDLKSHNVAVGLVHPGFVLTGFDSGTNTDKPADKRRQGQRDVDVSAKGVLQAVDQITLETTGSFLHGNYGDGVKPLNW